MDGLQEETFLSSPPHTHLPPFPRVLILEAETLSPPSGPLSQSLWHMQTWEIHSWRTELGQGGHLTL